MHLLRMSIRDTGEHDRSVLIVGATGTGKERVAHEVHLASQRSGALVPLNCATLSATLAEAELGHDVKVPAEHLWRFLAHDWPLNVRELEQLVLAHAHSGFVGVLPHALPGDELGRAKTSVRRKHTPRFCSQVSSSTRPTNASMR